MKQSVRIGLLWMLGCVWMPSSFASLESEIQELESPHVFLFSQNLGLLFYKNRDSLQYAELLEDLWSKAESKHPEWNWRLLSQDLVRLRIAKIYAQSLNQDCAKQSVLQNLKKYAIQRQNSDDEDIRVLALSFPYQNTQEDIDRLANIVRASSSAGDRIVAAMTLATQPSAKAKEVLIDLKEAVNDGNIIGKIDEALELREILMADKKVGCESDNTE